MIKSQVLKNASQEAELFIFLLVYNNRKYG